MTRIFVFGSNLAGVHGAGSARHALESCGAEWGVGVGLRGESYAIPTKDRNIRTMPLEDIALFVADFLTFARERPEMTFDVVAIGCGLAGFKPEQIAPMFASAPTNCKLPPEFVAVIGETSDA